MKSISCGIVEDLLPLYMDGICSEESKELIENHMKACTQCQEKFDRMKSSSLSMKNVEEKLDESQITDRSSAIRKEKTELDMKASVFSMIFYVVAILALLLIQSMGEKAYQAYLRFEMRYILAVMAIELAVWLILGALIAFIGSRPKDSIKTFVLELIVIGVPSLFMVASMFTAPFMPEPLRNFIIQNVTIITAIGALLLGCEVFRYLRMKRWSKEYK